MRWFAGAVALVVVIVVAVAVVRSSGEPTTIGTNRWTSYRVQYREAFTVAATPTVRYEDLMVHRPYEAADLTYDSPCVTSVRACPSLSATAPISGSISTETALYSVRPGGGPVLVGGRQPGPPSGDQDLETQIGDLVDRHLAADLHRSQRIAGRMCHMFRFRDPPSGTIKPLKGASEHDDVCLADGGLVLSERWTIDARVAFTRIATKVSRHAPPLPSVAGAIAPQPDQAVAAFAHVVHGLKTFIAPPPRPRGFHAQPVVELDIPSPSPFQMPVASVTASIVWAFSSHARTMFVEAGLSRAPWQDGDTVTKPIRLAHLGRASTAIRSDGAEIRVPLSGGRWARIRGTMPLRALVRYADELRLAP